MAFTQKSIMRGALWTIGAYGASVILRFGSNIILTRIIAPDVFGVMLIINTIRNGIELLSDVGISQNIVHNRIGEFKDFRNTAWTIQIFRGFILSSIIFILAVPLADIYHIPTSAIQLSALTVAILGSASVSIHLLQRRLQFIRLNLFDLALDLIGAVLVLSFALASPTIWSLIFASILTSAIRTGASFLLPDAAVRLVWDRSYARQILSFGKWIYISSLLIFLASSFDKLYLGQSIPLGLLGIYGLARNVSDLPTALFGRLGHSLIFPIVAAEQSREPTKLRAQISPIRLKLLLGCAACLAFGVAFGDFAIHILYDSRYHAASWMLPVMLVGAWAAILCSLNEYALMGVGKPIYGAVGNLLKLVSLVVGIPLTLSVAGLGGVVAFVALSEFLRYASLALGQRRERLSFFFQDIGASALMVCMLGLMTLGRWWAGWGTCFDGFTL